MIAPGMVLLNTLDENRSLGTVLIAVGGLFLIIAFRQKSEGEKATGQE